MASYISLFAAGLAVLVVALEVWRQRGSWQGWQLQHWRGVGIGMILAAGTAAGLSAIPGVEVPLALDVLLGGLLGLALCALSPAGMAAPALGVLAASGWTVLFGSAQVEVLLPQVAALGLGAGLVAMPGLWLTPESSRGSGWVGLAEVWVLVSASTWGSRLANLTEGGASQWLTSLPPALGALALLCGTLTLLVSTPETKPWQVWLGRLVGIGVAVLLTVVLLLNVWQQPLTYGLCFGVGLLGSWLLALLDPHPASVSPTGWDPHLLWRGVVALTVAGASALLALRLGGSYGAAVVGIGVLAFPSRWGVAAGLFLAVRPLVQSLLYEFDLNLSGINITHSYTYAGLYLGISGVILALAFLITYGSRSPALTVAGLAVSSVAGSILVGYFTHLEPQAAFLLGGMMVAFIAAVLDPLVPAGQGWGLQGLIWIGLATLAALVTPELTQLGNQATRLDRVWVLLGVSGVLAVIAIGIQVWDRFSRRSQAPASP